MLFGGFDVERFLSLSGGLVGLGFYVLDGVGYIFLYAANIAG